MNKKNNYSTPSFIIDKKVLDENIINIKDGCSILNNKTIIGYSLKTNSLPFLIKYMNAKKIHIEVVSSDEYKYVQELGIKNKNIIYNGPMKDRKTLIKAVKSGAIVNIETFREFDWLLESNISNKKIGIRINIPIKKGIIKNFEYLNDGSRFGFDINDVILIQYIKRLKKEKNIEICGFHFHLSTKERNKSLYKYIIEYANKISDILSIDTNYIDIGGGYLGGKENSFKNYTQLIKETISKYSRFKNTTIIIEPGAAIVATAVSYLTRVIDIKNIDKKKFITIDGSRIHLDPTFSNKKYKYETNCHIKSKNKIIICGFSCMERDRIELDENWNFKIGDYIKFKNIGAYTMTFIANFICSYPTVYLKNKNYIIIKKKKNLKKYLR